MSCSSPGQHRPAAFRSFRSFRSFRTFRTFRTFATFATAFTAFTALALLLAGCPSDEPAPAPVPTAVEVAEALRDEGLPVEAISDRAGGGCRGDVLGNGATCLHLAYFLDERSAIEPHESGYAAGDRYNYGAAVEIYPDAETASRRGEQLGREAEPHPETPYAIFSAGPVVLYLGAGFLYMVGPPYVGADYSEALETHYGAVTFTATNPARFQTPQ